MFRYPISLLAVLALFFIVTSGQKVSAQQSTVIGASNASVQTPPSSFSSDYENGSIGSAQYLGNRHGTTYSGFGFLTNDKTAFIFKFGFGGHLAYPEIIAWENKKGKKDPYPKVLTYKLMGAMSDSFTEKELANLPADTCKFDTSLGGLYGTVLSISGSNVAHGQRQQFTASLQITGGTGRLAGATGTVNVTGSAEYGGSKGTCHISGSISVPNATVIIIKRTPVSAEVNRRKPSVAPTPTSSDVGRHLTKGEIAMAKEVFGTSIPDYTVITIYHHKWLEVNPFQDENGAVTRPNKIYYGESDPGYSNDISLATPLAQHHFIHEMTHIYQYDIGRDVGSREIIHPSDRIYKYILDEKKTFNNYGLEQQAAMVADYYGVAFIQPLLLPTNTNGKYSESMYIRILPFVPSKL